MDTVVARTFGELLESPRFPKAWVKGTSGAAYDKESE